MTTPEWILQMKDISKHFSGVYALQDVSVKVKKGEIHALCGENGAGKSTLMKILSGVYPHGDFSGEILVNGQIAVLKNTKDSERMGISIIHQELNLVPEFTVAENIFLGNEITKRGIISVDEIYRETMRLIRLVGLDVSPDQKVKYLGIGEQQLIEIAKALKNHAEILILDEPTAALTEREVEVLLGILHELRAQEVTCIYISHKLKEVLRISDTVTVLRDGRTVSSTQTKQLTESKIISMMVGRDLSDLFPRVRVEAKEVALEIADWTVTSNVTGTPVVKHASLSVRQGEVLGIYGLVGAGRTELVSSIFGGYPGKVVGKIRVHDSEAVIRSPEDAIKSGIALVTEDRKQFGLILDMDVQGNITLPMISLAGASPILNGTDETLKAQGMVRDLRIKTASLESPVKTLSGGNQQKIVIAKWLLTNPKVLMLDEPTRGIDVGAKYEIYQMMNDLTERGLAVIMVSSELPEVLGMSDRLLVMANGVIQGELNRGEMTEEKVMQLATGGN